MGLNWSHNLDYRTESSSFVAHIGLVLLQDDVSGELRLRNVRETSDNDQQGLQARQPQRVTVVRRRHEGHADQVTQVEDQEVYGEPSEDLKVQRATFGWLLCW